MTPAKIYPFSIPAGGSFPLLVIGDYAKILTSNGPLTLQGDTFGSIGPILAGQGMQDSQFSRLVLEDKSGATNNGTILIADNAFIDDRITGSVEVIDGGKNRTLSNQAYSGNFGVPGLAGNYAHAQIWNPAGSGKNLFVKSFMLSSDINGFVNISHATSEIAGALVYGKNKKVLGPDSIAKLNYQNLAAQQTPKILMGVNSFPTGQIIINFQEPVMVPPNSGLNFVQFTIAAAINVNAEYIEEAIL